MVVLEPLDEFAFDAYRRQLLARYADSIASAWEVDLLTAEGFATSQLESLLPEGVVTNFHQLRQVWREGRQVGVVWFSSQPGSIAYVYDLFVEEPCRRQGIASEVMRLVEIEASEQGCFALSLHVFESNAVAQQFYQALGLRPIGTQLFKRFHNAGAAKIGGQ